MTEAKSAESRPQEKRDWTRWLVLAATLLLAAWPRWLAFQSAQAQPLEHDAQTFFKLAGSPVSLWSASPREPFFILLHRIAYLSLAGRPDAIRVQSLAFSFIMIGLVTGIALRLFKSRAAALLTGLVLAFTPFLAFQATRGLRLELFLSLALALQATLTLSAKPLSRPRAAAAGILAAMLCLTRQVGILIAAGVFATAFIKLGTAHGWKRTGKALTLALGLALLLTAPFYIAQARQYGRAFYIGVQDATFWRNQEFRDQPGHPSSAELLRDPYLGPPITPGEYMFGLHSPSQVLARVGKGYYLAFAWFYRQAMDGFWWLLILALPGAVVLCLRRREEWLVLFILVLGPFAFILPLSVVGHQSVDARFSMHGYPLVALFIGAGADWLFDFFRRARGEALNAKSQSR